MSGPELTVCCQTAIEPKGQVSIAAADYPIFSAGNSGNAIFLT